MKRILTLSALLLTMTAFASKTDLQLVKKHMKHAGAVNYSTDHGWWLDDYEDLYVGYDQQKVAKVGVIVQVLKESYKKVTAYVVVKKQGESFSIDQVIIPDLDKIKKPKQRAKMEEMMKKFKHFQCVDKKQNQIKLDAISGATFCHKYSYKYINEMSKELIESMRKDKHKNKLSPLS
jgi:hypothetical protein